MLWALLIAVLLLGVTCCSGAAHNPLQALFKASSPDVTIDNSILFFEPFNAIDGEDDIITTGLHDGSESRTLSPSLSPPPPQGGDGDNDDDEDIKTPSKSSSKTPSHTPSLPITGLHHAEDVNGSVAVYSGLWAFPRNILYNKVARLTETVVSEQKELLEGRAAEYHTIEKIRDPTKRALAIAKFSDKKGKKMKKKAAAVRDREKLEKYYGEWGVRSLGVFHADEESDTSLRTGGSGEKVNSAELPTSTHSRHYVAVTRSPPITTAASSPLRRRTMDELESIFLKSLEEENESTQQQQGNSPHTTSTIPKHRVLREIALSFNFKSEQVGESAYTADKALYARDVKEERDGFRRQLRAEGGKHVSHTEEDEITRRQKSNDVLMRKRRDERRRERRSGRSNSEDERLPYDDFERNHKYCGEGHVRLIPSMKAMADSIFFNADGNTNTKPLGKLFDAVGQTSVFRRSRKAGVMTDRVEESIKTTFRAQYARLPDDETEAPIIDDGTDAPTPSDPLHALNITRLALLLGNKSDSSCQGVTYPFSTADPQGFRIVRRRRPNFQLLQDNTDGDSTLGPIFPPVVSAGKGGEDVDSSAVSEPQVVEEKFSHNFPYLLRFGPKICNGRFELDMGLGRFVPFYYFPKPGPDPIASRDAKATYFDLRNRLYGNATLIDVFASGKVAAGGRAQQTALPQGATLAWEASPSARPHSIRIGSHPYTQTFAIRIIEEVVPPASSLENHPDANTQLPSSSVSESFLNMEMMRMSGRQHNTRRLVKGDDAFSLVEDKAVKYERAVRVARAMQRDGVSPFLPLPVENPDGDCNNAAVGIADEPPLRHDDNIQQHEPLTAETRRSEQLLSVYTSHDGWLRTPIDRRKAATTNMAGSSSNYHDASVGYWQRAIAASKADGTALKEHHLSTRYVVEVYVDGALVADNVLEHEFPGMVNLNTRRESFTQLEEEESNPKEGSTTYMNPLHSHFDLQAFVHSLAHIGLDVKQNRPGSLFDNVVIGTDFDAVQMLSHKAREGAAASAIPKSSREVRAAVQRKIDHEAKVGDYLTEKNRH